MLRILLHQSNMILPDYRVSLEVDMNVLVISLSLHWLEKIERKGIVHLVAGQFWYWSSCVGGIPSWHLTDLAITSPISRCKQHKTRGLWGNWGFRAYRGWFMRWMRLKKSSTKAPRSFSDSNYQPHRERAQVIVQRKWNGQWAHEYYRRNWNKLFLLHLVVLS